MISQRLSRRLLRHHVPLAAATSAVAVVLYLTRPYPDVLSRLSFASAYPALALLAVTLGVGPFMLLTAGQMPTSLDLRRDFGIWAGMTGCFHAVVGQCVHLRGRPWLYYIYDPKREPHLLPIRHDAFGIANYTGLAATLILITLLATSNDASLRRLGTPGWKRLQRWNYACFGLTAIHCFLYQVGVESQILPFVGAAIVCVTLTLLIQLAGFRQRRTKHIEMFIRQK
jgi:methionine sulfoxide reductase heme-binding subunit